MDFVNRSTPQNTAPFSKENDHHPDSHNETRREIQPESIVRPKQRQNDPINAHQKVIEHLGDLVRKPITSVYDLASMMTNHYINMFDEYSIPEEYHFFTFYKHSISDVVCPYAANTYIYTYSIF
jgi:hypothetical protein